MSKYRQPDLTDLENLKDFPNIQIEILKKALADTDYKAIKFMEGEITEEEFAPVRKQRKEWRERINELEVRNVQNI